MSENTTKSAQSENTTKTEETKMTTKPAAKTTKKTTTKKTTRKAPAKKSTAKKPAAKSTKKPAAKKSTKKSPAKAKKPSASQMFQQLIMEQKLTDDEIFAAVQKQFGLDDKKRNYVGWYRAYLKREGKGEFKPVTK